MPLRVNRRLAQGLRDRVLIEMRRRSAATLGLMAGFLLGAVQSAFADDDPLTAIVHAVKSHDCATVLSLYPPYWDANKGMSTTRRRNLDSAYNICLAPKRYWSMLDQLGSGFPDKP